MTALIRSMDVSPEELIQRAKDLGPALKKRSAAATQARQLPEETIQDFKEAGFFRILQPKRWGGYELDPEVFFDCVVEIARSCPSSAWVLGVVGIHNWQLALFPDQAQQDAWGEDTSVLISSSYMPVGKVTPVEGGYMLSGRWGFSSGSDYCDWAFLGAFIHSENGPPDMRTFMVPKSDYTLDDDWHTSGLKATGSKSVVVDDVFVPEYRTHKMADGFRMKSPGHSENDAAVFKIPFGQIFTRSVATPAVGMAQGALDAYMEVCADRVSRADGKNLKLDPNTQEVCAKAALAIDEVRTLMRRDYKEMMDYARTGEDIPIPVRVRYRYNAAAGTDKCIRVVDELVNASGAAAIFLNNPINSFWRDIHAARAHHANNPHKSGRNYGGVMMGMKTQDWFI